MYVLEAAIGSVPGFVELSHEGLHDNLSWGSQTVRVAQGVPIVTIDDAVSVVPNAELFIVKIDIEGFEHDLFRENVGWIDRATMIIVEPHDWLLPGRRTSKFLQKEMGQRDFDLFICDENLVYVRSDV